jgi:3-oxoadipate enol-lactonase/4-carboxymuconolactone decarboxylase
VPDFRVLRLDTRGHGASDAPAGDYSLDLLADDVLAVMDAAGVGRAAICGTSLGGMIAMASPQGARARQALVLACTSPAMDPSPGSAPGTDAPRAWRHRRHGAGPLLLRSLPRPASRNRRDRPRRDAGPSPDGYCGCGAAIRDMALLDRLPAITARPWSSARTGRRDAVRGPCRADRRRHSRRPHALVEGAHLPSLEAPAAFAGAMRDFLAEVLDGTSAVATPRTRCSRPG